MYSTSTQALTKIRNPTMTNLKRTQEVRAETRQQQESRFQDRWISLPHLEVGVRLKTTLLVA
jgi:hypothetical protein